MKELEKVVFSFLDLDNQKNYMERHMKKPKELKVCKLATVVSWLNNELKYYPGGSV